MVTRAEVAEKVYQLIDEVGEPDSTILHGIAMYLEGELSLDGLTDHIITVRGHYKVIQEKAIELLREEMKV
jgi:hypothetical protein